VGVQRGVSTAGFAALQFHRPFIKIFEISSWDIDRTLRERYANEVCETRIAENVSVAESPSLNRDVFAHAPESRGAKDYAELLAELEACGFLK